jgi:hypothetical protein
MPIEENQFVHASVPVRLFLSGLMGAVVLLNRGRMSMEGFWEFVGLAIMDGAAAVWLGWKLGTWDGMVKGAER